MPLKYASLCAFNNKETLLKTLKTIKECAGILIDENQNARTFIKKHLFYYYQIILHSNAELFASYNFYSSINFFKTKTFLENKKNDLEEKESLKIFNYFSSLPAKKVRKIKQKSILILSDFQIQEKLKKTLSKTFPKIEYISYFQFMNHNLFFPCECLPFFDKSYDITIYSTSYRRKKDKKRLLSELKRISTNSFLKLSVQSDKIEEIKII